MDGQFLYTQEQARSIVGISAESLRHWRRLVPFLKGRSGKAARFAFGEVLGLAVTAEVVGRFGISIGHVHESIEALFQLLTQLPIVQPGSVVILHDSTSMLLVSDIQVSSLESKAAILIPLDPLIENLRMKLLQGLRLPPQSVLPFYEEVASR